MHSNFLMIAGVLGLGGPEAILILVIFIILFGGKRLPELAKGLGKSVKEFKRASQEMEESVRAAIENPPPPPGGPGNQPSDAATPAAVPRK